MTLAEELKARGLIEHESAPAQMVLGEPRTVYLGIDPAADSVHVGHLVPLLAMKRLGDAGHKLIFLVGGGTGMIGDPREAGGGGGGVGGGGWGGGRGHWDDWRPERGGRARALR